MTVYGCGNKRCREYRKEFTGMDIKDAELGTCLSCGEVIWFVRLSDELNVSDDDE
jgi:hypothetical protein